MNPTCVRVPVFYGHAEAVHVELHQPLDAEQVKSCCAMRRVSPCLTTRTTIRPRCATQPARTKCWWAGFARIFLTCGINMWIVADNVRKGAATNSVQIAELLVRDYL